MAHIDLVMPKMGESVAEATIIRWLKKEGDRIDTDESLLEIATDKVDSDVPSPVAGILIKKLFAEEDIVKVGAVIAIIDTEVESPKQTPAPVQTPAPNQTPAIAEAVTAESITEGIIPGMTFLNEISSSKPQNGTEVKPLNGQGADRFYSPLVKSIAQNEGIGRQELDTIQGSGNEGRLTKNDMMSYLDSRIKADTAGAAAPVQGKAAPAILAAPAQPETLHARPVQPPAAKSAGSSAFQEGDEIIEMDRMRRIIAEHMIFSKDTSAHVTSFVEADVTNMVQWRDKTKEGFKKRENENITFTPIFIEAAARALREFPMVNVSVNEKQIILHRHINIGMAAALPSGNLIVPVIKDADQKNLLGLTKAVNDLANRARTNKLQADEVSGGTFTLTNVGSFGNIMGTPIINQPQVAILAVGAIKKKPAVIETEYGDVIAIRHMMYLSLSYDHRVVDGAMGGKFLRRIADHLEAFDLSREV